MNELDLKLLPKGLYRYKEKSWRFTLGNVCGEMLEGCSVKLVANWVARKFALSREVKIGLSLWIRVGKADDKEYLALLAKTKDLLNSDVSESGHIWVTQHSWSFEGHMVTHNIII